MRDTSDRPSTADARVLRTLAEARAETRATSDRLLEHVPDLGDLTTQRLLDTWVEQAADALRALSEAAEECLLHRGRGGHPDAVTPSYAADGIASPRRRSAPGGAP